MITLGQNMLRRQPAIAARCNCASDAHFLRCRITSVDQAISTGRPRASQRSEPPVVLPRVRSIHALLLQIQAPCSLAPWSFDQRMLAETLLVVGSQSTQSRGDKNGL